VRGGVGPARATSARWPNGQNKIGTEGQTEARLQAARWLTVAVDALCTETHVAGYPVDDNGIHMQPAKYSTSAGRAAGEIPAHS